MCVCLHTLLPIGLNLRCVNADDACLIVQGCFSVILSLRLSENIYESLRSDKLRVVECLSACRSSG